MDDKRNHDLAASSGMVDIDEAAAVEITLDTQGKLWINIDGRCALRIGLCKAVTMDDPVRGLDHVR